MEALRPCAAAKHSVVNRELFLTQVFCFHDGADHFWIYFRNYRRFARRSIANATVKTTNTATQAGETVSNDIRTLCIPFVAAKHLHTRSDFTGI
jgi:hypothetical protein